MQYMRSALISFHQLVIEHEIDHIEMLHEITSCSKTEFVFESTLFHRKTNRMALSAKIIRMEEFIHKTEI